MGRWRIYSFAQPGGYVGGPRTRPAILKETPFLLDYIPFRCIWLVNLCIYTHLSDQYSRKVALTKHLSVSQAYASGHPPTASDNNLRAFRLYSTDFTTQARTTRLGTPKTFPSFFAQTESHVNMQRGVGSILIEDCLVRRRSLFYSEHAWEQILLYIAERHTLIHKKGIRSVPRRQKNPVSVTKVRHRKETQPI
jgi:hypothetical protein